MARFRVRARTVDMLGRQKIAGIPTAISELFKNAHDAYARNVEVDYFRDENLFVLRDDGLGMTKEDFEQRWLTLGTESKIGSASLPPPPRDPDQDIRPTLGEKGIGRLAIAIIGPQVLILSRARRERTPSKKLVAAYIHWGLFELPGVDLDDVTIPVREFPGGTLPSHHDVQMMIDEAISSLQLITDKKNPKLAQVLSKHMKGFNVDPLQWSKTLQQPTLLGNGTGTHFFIQPADPIIQDDIDTRQADNKATRFERNLIGFTNTMTPEHEAPRIIARFRDHRHEGAPEELIGTHTIDEVMAELQRLQRSSSDIGSLTTLRETLALQITSVHETERTRLERMRDQLTEVKRLWDKDAYDSVELTEALEEEIDELRARRDADLELAQIGLALNTISHEFDKTVGLLRDGLRRLKAWADTNPDLRNLYRDIRNSFDHLDEYLTLFTPLDRRVHRSKVAVTGKQISEFLEKLFGPRLARHGIKLTATNKFLQSSIHSYPSSILPAFVNLVDNSIFWLQRKTSQREIKLEATGKDLLVKDNGPGVNTRDR